MKKISFIKALLGMTLIASLSVFMSCGPKEEPEPETPAKATVTGIVADTSNATLSFTEGDAFSYEGLVVSSVKSDNKKTVLDASAYTVTVNEANLVEDKLVVVNANENHEEEVTVTVSAKIGKNNFSTTYTIVVAQKANHLHMYAAEDFVPYYYEGDDIDLTKITVKAFYADHDDAETEGFTVAVTKDNISFDKAGSYGALTTVTYAGTSVSKCYIPSVGSEVDAYVCFLTVKDDLQLSYSEGDAPVNNVKVLFNENDWSARFDISVKDEEGNDLPATFDAAGSYAYTITINAKEGSAVQGIREWTKAVTVKVVKAVSSIALDTTNAVLSYWKDETVDLSGVKVNVTYAEPAEGDVTELTFADVTTTAVPDGSESGSYSVTATYGGKSDSLTVNVYEVAGSVSKTEYTTKDTLPSLAGLSVKCGKDTVEGSSVAIYSDAEGTTAASDFGKAGKYYVIAKAGSLKKTVAEITVTTYVATPELVVLPSVSDNGGNACATRLAGDMIFIGLDSSSLGLNGETQASFVSSLSVTLSKGELKTEAEGFTNGMNLGFHNYQDGKLASAALLLILKAGITGPVTVEVAGTYKGTALSATISFDETGKYIPSDYEVTGIKVSGKTSVKSGNTIQFSAVDSTYGIPQDVEWSISPETGSISETGLYKAPDSNDTDTEITVTAKYSDTISGTAKFTLKADTAASAIPYEVELSNEGGAWMKTTVTWGDASDYEISADNSALLSMNLSVDGKAGTGVNWTQSRTNGVCFARSFGSANLTSSAVTQTLTFRVEAKNGKKYDFVVVCKGGNPDMTVESCEITEVSELTLSAAKLTFESPTAQTVTVSAVGITGFDVSEVAVESKDEEVATVAYDAGTITVTPVADGETTVEVSFGSYKAEIAVVVQTSMEEVAITFDSSSTKVEGAGIFLMYSSKLASVPVDPVISVVFDGGTNYSGYNETITKNDYVPTWSRDDGMYFTVAAGFPNGGDFTHTVTLSFVMDGKKYVGTAHFVGNTFDSSK